jgi:hypothetical protein
LYTGSDGHFNYFQFEEIMNKDIMEIVIQNLQSSNLYHSLGFGFWLFENIANYGELAV